MVACGSRRGGLIRRASRFERSYSEVVSEQPAKRSWLGSGQAPPRLVKFMTWWFIGLGVLAFVGVILVLINAFVFHRA